MVKISNNHAPIPLNVEPAVAANIEREAGWQGNLSLSEIISLLKNQAPYTYAISEGQPNIFLLSFVRPDDHGIVHIQFDKISKGEWHYVNGADNLDTNLTRLIRKMMHLTDSMPNPIPLI